MSQSKVITKLAAVGGSVRWYLRELMGDSRYSRYVEHLRSHDPGSIVMTEQEYWRSVHRDEAANPRSRCC